MSVSWFTAAHQYLGNTVGQFPHFAEKIHVEEQEVPFSSPRVYLRLRELIHDAQTRYCDMVVSGYLKEELAVTFMVF